MRDTEKMGTLIGIAIGLLLVLGFVYVQASMESATYNRLTGASTTWWDAMWVELRVSDAPRMSKDGGMK